MKGILRFLTGEEGKEFLLDPEDQGYMKGYIDAIATSVDNLFQKQISDEEARAMEAYIRQDKDQQVPAQLAQMAQNHQMEAYLLRAAGRVRLRQL